MGAMILTWQNLRKAKKNLEVSAISLYILVANPHDARKTPNDM
jgi:hypothetical protein